MCKGALAAQPESGQEKAIAARHRTVRTKSTAVESWGCDERHHASSPGRIIHFVSFGTTRYQADGYRTVRFERLFCCTSYIYEIEHGIRNIIDVETMYVSSVGQAYAVYKNNSLCDRKNIVRVHTSGYSSLEVITPEFGQRDSRQRQAAYAPAGMRTRAHEFDRDAHRQGGLPPLNFAPAACAAGRGGIIVCRQESARPVRLCLARSAHTQTGQNAGPGSSQRRSRVRKVRHASAAIMAEICSFMGWESNAGEP